MRGVRKVNGKKLRVKIAFASILTAPFGVKLSYKLSAPRIRQIFAIFLIVILVRMLSSFFS